MKKIFMVLAFLTLLFSTLSARYIFDGSITFTKHSANKDSLSYIIIEKAGSVFDTVAIIDSSGGMYWNYLYPFNETRYLSRTPQALVSFVFDDGVDTDSSIMAPVFVAQGEVANSGIVESWVGEANRLTWSEILYLQNLGWEILNHSTTHPNLDTLTLDQVRTEFETCNDSALVHGITIYNAVYPYGQNADSVRRIAREYFRCARGVEYDLNGEVLETYCLASKCIDDSDSLSVYKALVDDAETTKRWLIFYAHSTDSDDADSIGALIDYIQAKTIPIVTISQGLDSIGNVFESGDAIAINESGFRLFGKEDRVYSIGWHAGYHNITGTHNIFLGYRAGYNNTTGDSNIVIGHNALLFNTTAYNNTAIGTNALYYHISGNNNTAIGRGALFSDTTGHSNTAVGKYALYSNASANSNTAVGMHALKANTTGSSNTAMGALALVSNTAGYNNTAMGKNASYSNKTGNYNTIMGVGALNSDIIGSNNIAVGYRAGYSTENGSGNIFLGFQAGYNETGSNKLYIDNSDTTAPLIYGEFDNNLLRFNAYVEVIDSLKIGAGEVLVKFVKLGTHCAIVMNSDVDTFWVASDTTGF